MFSRCCNHISFVGIACVLVRYSSCDFQFGSLYLASDALHNSIKAIQNGLVLPRQETLSMNRILAWNLVNLSQAVRDFTIELTISRFHPDHARSLRNLLQGVLRGIMAIKPNITLFEISSDENIVKESDIDAPAEQKLSSDKKVKAIEVVTKILRDPTRELIKSMIDAVNMVDTIITLMSNLGSSSPTWNTDMREFTGVSEVLRLRISEFDSANTLLTSHQNLSLMRSRDPQIREIFLFTHSVCQVAEKIEAVMEKVLMMQKNDCGWRVHLPSYPWSKSLLRTNAQVRHDRGGLTAGFYFQIGRAHV